ncbi:uncharacterized protein [Palaemon carinicauda]|uniref:uncharacterized protein n=1 Tax=Palaemon carinicauda TaxID=392227 RepID=UPI0035B6A95C
MRAISTTTDMVLLQQDLNTVTQWSTKNNMSLHEDKFEFMSHAVNRRNPLLRLSFTADLYQYSTSKGTLTHSDQLRDLGVTVTSDLKWTAHIRDMANKARQKAGWVLSVFFNRSPTIMLTLYKSMVRSLLEYCCPLWNPRSVSDIEELEGVQRTFTTRIAGSQHLNYWEKLKKLSIMSLQRQQERYILLHMWKILHGTVSNDLKIKFVSRPRTGFKAVVPPLRGGVAAYNQSLYDKSFAVIGPRLWNCLPVHINKIGEFEPFKRKFSSLLQRIPDKPPVKGYTSPNTNSILDWRMDPATLELWGGQDS